MDFFELAKARYSVRSFQRRPVEQEKIQKILEAGALSPTACNNQPQRYYVIQSAEAMEKLKKCTDYTFGAPLAILVCYDRSKSWKRSGRDNADSGETDASIATTQMMLALVELGLGSTWVGSLDPDEVIRQFELDGNIVPHALLPIGYPAEDAQPAPMHDQRKSVRSTAVFL